MFLLSISDYLSELAINALENASFPGDVVEQFLSTVSHDLNDYEGDSDYGVASPITFSEEDLAMLAILDCAASQREDSHYHQDGPEAGEWAGTFGCILWGSDRKWWGDVEYFQEENDLEARMDAFREDYYATLPCEDCGSEDQASCTCGFDDTAGPHPIGTAIRVNSFAGVALRIVRYRPDGRTVVHIVGDDKEWDVDTDEIVVLADDEFCSECGQIGCGHGNL